tara:strand:- start:4648 stop:4920 length:273 start_codon:yes stop_codon:yes gene_type:complete
MNKEDLNRLWHEYRSYEGTANDSINKAGMAANNFESVLNAALSLAQDLEDLKSEPNKVIDNHPELTREDVFLYDDEPDEAKQTADFARYG